MAKGNKNNIDKALEALTGALEIEPTGEEVQLEPDKTVKFDPDVELMEMKTEALTLILTLIHP